VIAIVHWPTEPIRSRYLRHAGTFSRADFAFDPERDRYTCPAGKELVQFRAPTQPHEAASLPSGAIEGRSIRSSGFPRRERNIEAMRKAGASEE
jgi:hypothetical protein